MRVKVFDGAGKNLLGLGNYTEDVSTYVIQMRSLANAEEKPMPHDIPEGGQLRFIPRNPKIVMDDGTVRYGCQVWWERVQEVVEVTDDTDYDPWAVSEN